MFTDIFTVIISYFLGAVPTGFLVARGMKGVDIRSQGSGNIGATNVARVVGKIPGILVLLADILKGLAAVTLVPAIFTRSPEVVALSGLAVVLGHNWPVFLKFRGGKGVAATLGVALGIDWRLGVFVIAVWIVLLILTRRVSVGSLGIGITLPVFIIARTPPAPIIGLGVILGVMIIWRHQKNIRRLFKGEEKRIF